MQEQHYRTRMVTSIKIGSGNFSKAEKWHSIVSATETHRPHYVSLWSKLVGTMWCSFNTWYKHGCSEGPQEHCRVTCSFLSENRTGEDFAQVQRYKPDPMVKLWIIRAEFAALLGKAQLLQPTARRSHCQFAEGPAAAWRCLVLSILATDCLLQQRQLIPYRENNPLFHTV